MNPTNSTKTEFDSKIVAKTWIELLIRAIEEDTSKKAPKCCNKFCVQPLPINPKKHGWGQRDLGVHQEWLCKICISAYDKNQFCEFCYQIYIENTSEFCALDGKEWALCEGNELCGRWAHVDCLANAYNKSVEEIMAEDFKYFCCNCEIKLSKKRKANTNKYLTYIILIEVLSDSIRKNVLIMRMPQNSLLNKAELSKPCIYY